MPDIQYKTPQEVASRLDVSPSTLRRWSDQFSEFLTQSASAPSGNGHRRYAEQDLETLITVKTYMNDGLTYEQVRQRLNQESESNTTHAIMSAEDVSMAAMSYVSETIDELRQGQLSVLNSQAANRELMGVLIQDNFNLKEENARLRERTLDIERQMGQIRRDEEARRERMREEIENKFMEIREMASRNPVTILQNRAGCLGSLFGGGGQVQAIPTQSSAPQQAGPQSTSQPRPYPRPPGPPE